MGEIFEVAVDIARLETEPHRVRKVVGDAAHPLQRTARIAIPAGLADEGEAVERPRRAGVGLEGADDRQDLRGRAAVVLLRAVGQGSEGRRVGTAGVRTGRSGWEALPLK